MQIPMHFERVFLTNRNPKVIACFGLWNFPPQQAHVICQEIILIISRDLHRSTWWLHKTTHQMEVRGFFKITKRPLAKRACTSMDKIGIVHSFPIDCWEMYLLVTLCASKQQGLVFSSCHQALTTDQCTVLSVLPPSQELEIGGETDFWTVTPNYVSHLQGLDGVTLANILKDAEKLLCSTYHDSMLLAGISHLHSPGRPNCRVGYIPVSAYLIWRVCKRTDTQCKIFRTNGQLLSYRLWCENIKSLDW